MIYCVGVVYRNRLRIWVCRQSLNTLKLLFSATDIVLLNIAIEFLPLWMERFLDTTENLYVLLIGDIGALKCGNVEISSLLAPNFDALGNSALFLF